jgi:Lantibiotic biosynthesis dehydratase C-term
VARRSWRAARAGWAYRELDASIPARGSRGCAASGMPLTNPGTWLWRALPPSMRKAAWTSWNDTSAATLYVGRSAAATDPRSAPCLPPTSGPNAQIWKQRFRHLTIPVHRRRSKLCDRSEALRPVLARFRDLHEAGRLERPLTDVLCSLGHMFVNRLLREAGDRDELRVHDALARLYESQLARERARRSGLGRVNL